MGGFYRGRRSYTRVKSSSAVVLTGDTVDQIKSNVNF